MRHRQLTDLPMFTRTVKIESLRTPVTSKVCQLPNKQENLLLDPTSWITGIPPFTAGHSQNSRTPLQQIGSRKATSRELPTTSQPVTEVGAITTKIIPCHLLNCSTLVTGDLQGTPRNQIRVIKERGIACRMVYVQFAATTRRIGPWEQPNASPATFRFMSDVRSSYGTKTLTLSMWTTPSSPVSVLRTGIAPFVGKRDRISECRRSIICTTGMSHLSLNFAIPRKFRGFWSP